MEKHNTNSNGLFFQLTHQRFQTPFGRKTVTVLPSENNQKPTKDSSELNGEMLLNLCMNFNLDTLELSSLRKGIS